MAYRGGGGRGGHGPRALETLGTPHGCKRWRTEGGGHGPRALETLGTPLGVRPRLYMKSYIDVISIFAILQKSTFIHAASNEEQYKKQIRWS